MSTDIDVLDVWVDALQKRLKLMGYQTDHPTLRRRLEMETLRPSDPLYKAQQLVNTKTLVFSGDTHSFHQYRKKYDLQLKEISYVSKLEDIEGLPYSLLVVTGSAYTRKGYAQIISYARYVGFYLHYE